MGLGAAPRRGRRRRGVFDEINITPLTDVMLVLLIIFMATAQFIEPAQDQGLDLNLPSATQVDDLETLGGLRVKVDRDGNMTLDDQPVAPEQLAAALQQAAVSADQMVIVEGDRETVLQNVVDIMDAALAAGLANVVLATAADEPELPSEPAAEPESEWVIDATSADASPFVTPPPPGN